MQAKQLTEPDWESTGHARGRGQRPR